MKKKGTINLRVGDMGGIGQGGHGRGWKEEKEWGK